MRGIGEFSKDFFPDRITFLSDVRELTNAQAVPGNVFYGKRTKGL